jgi:tRNA A37 threonylcarbamoyladenosine synthetase subunit TsaC/SUA5/YrdC
MVKRNSTSRFSNINSKVILTQTDTTVGFLSQDTKSLSEIKSRQASKPFILVYKNFSTFKHDGRVPNTQKNLVRRLKKTTFIVKNTSFRIVADTLHSSILRTTTWNYSTSANESTKKFSRMYCEAKADIIIENKEGLFEGNASKLYKINNRKIKRLR